MDGNRREDRKKSGRVDLNHRPQRPERCALTGLRYAPMANIIGKVNFDCKGGNHLIFREGILPDEILRSDN
jgi:hypothetical protein